MTHEEETNFLNKYTEVLRTFKPDLVMGYGCDALCRSLWMEARTFGIPTVYHVILRQPSSIASRCSDMVLTDSEATAKIYKETEGLTIHPYGICINADLVTAKTRNPQTVTFINPGLCQGRGDCCALDSHGQ